MPEIQELITVYNQGLVKPTFHNVHTIAKDIPLGKGGLLQFIQQLTKPIARLDNPDVGCLSTCN